MSMPSSSEAVATSARKCAALEALLGIEARFLGEAAVMRGDVGFAQPFRQMARQALGQAPRIDEHQGRAVLRDQLGEPVVDALPDLVRHHRFEWCRRFERQIARTGMAGVDDRAGVVGHAEQEAGDQLDRLLRRRQPDALQAAAAQRGQAFERERQMRAALVRRQRVDLVDDHRARGGEHRAARLGTEQDVERFRRGDDDVRRAPAHAVALGCRRVAGAHQGADLDLGQALRAQRVGDAGQRRLEVALDVVRQRLERRDIDDVGLVLQSVGQALAHQGVDRREKRGQGLARAGRRGQQHMTLRLDRRPRLRLRGSGAGKAAREPSGDGGVKGGFGHCL